MKMMIFPFLSGRVSLSVAQLWQEVTTNRSGDIRAGVMSSLWSVFTIQLLIHEHLPAGVDERAAEEEAVHRLVHQPVEHHLPVPWADGHPQLEVAALAQVVVADGEQVHHLHVEGDGGAQHDGGKLVGHLFAVDEHGTWTSKTQPQRQFRMKTTRNNSLKPLWKLFKLLNSLNRS